MKRMIKLGEGDDFKKFLAELTKLNFASESDASGATPAGPEGNKDQFKYVKLKKAQASDEETTGSSQ